MAFDLSGYVEVKDRIAEFKKEYPNGRLTSEILATNHSGFVAVKAYAYRTPDDPVPGTGLAWEPVPGKTPYTKDSELQNAETSAWGRALVAALIADSSGSVASADEVRNRQDGAAESGTGGRASASPSGLSCPECSAPVIDQLEAHFGDNKKPAWKCSSRSCPGGKPKQGGGTWGWASWDVDWGQPQPEREDFDAPPLEWGPDEEPFD